MPTALTTTPDDNTKQRALVPLVSAHINGHFGTKLEDFGRAVFGAQAFDEAVEVRKAEMKGMPVNGSYGSTGICTSIMRSYIVLRGLGETENAEELRAIAEEAFLRDTTAAELARVEAGW
ncbi:hypothetical protein LTR08_005636 [Meristemomyces frigidus]|nr:hypothetical protein LTR08_005636 [Meristemomyces frigidus]